MYGQLIEQAEKYLRSLYAQDNIAEQLKRLRTLQRRLQAEKTSFQKVLNEVRAVLAVNYLSDKRLKALEVAMLLGYSSISSFTTAFKSWYDMPPVEYREKYLTA